MLVLTDGLWDGMRRAETCLPAVGSADGPGADNACGAAATITGAAETGFPNAFWKASSGLAGLTAIGTAETAWFTRTSGAGIGAGALAKYVGSPSRLLALGTEPDLTLAIGAGAL